MSWYKYSQAPHLESDISGHYKLYDTLTRLSQKIQPQIDSRLMAISEQIDSKIKLYNNNLLSNHNDQSRIFAYKGIMACYESGIATIKNLSRTLPLSQGQYINQMLAKYTRGYEIAKARADALITKSIPLKSHVA